MNTVRVAHCADLHLGAPYSYLPAAQAAERQAEALLTFGRIIDFCRNNAADLLIIAGDLFDTPSVDKSLAVDVFSKIASIPDTLVVISAGNHDPLTADCPYLTETLPQNLVVFSENMGSVEVSDKNLRVIGISFATSSFTKNLVLPTADGEKINILAIHGDLNASADSVYNPVSAREIGATGMDYVALGHIHKPSGVLREGMTYYAYPGCPEASGFDETGERGILFGEIGKGVCSMELVPMQKRRFEEVAVDVTACSSTSQIADKIIWELEKLFGDRFSQNLYKIILCGTTEEPFIPDLAAILPLVSDKVYFAKLRDNTSFAVDFDALSQEFTLRGLFVKRMLQKIAEADESGKPLLQDALRLGLRAFDSEVKPNEN